jgi:hypothetical protein
VATPFVDELELFRTEEEGRPAILVSDRSEGSGVSDELQNTAIAWAMRAESRLKSSNHHHQPMSVSTVATPGFEPVAHRRPAELRERYMLGPLEHHPLNQGGLLTFSLRTPQRNRNELGETTVNKTWRKHLPQQ